MKCLRVINCTCENAKPPRFASTPELCLPSLGFIVCFRSEWSAKHESHMDQGDGNSGAETTDCQDVCVLALINRKPSLSKLDLQRARSMQIAAWSRSKLGNLLLNLEML